MARPLSLLLVAAALLSTGARAGVLGTMSGASAPLPAERVYNAVILKPAELKSCVVDAYSIDVSDALFDAERPSVEQERGELRKLQEAAAGKPTGATAAKAAELRTKAQAFNARIAALNSRVAYAQDARDRFSKTCKGRKYYFEDLAAVRGQLPPEIAAVIPAK